MFPPSLLSCLHSLPTGLRPPVARPAGLSAPESRWSPGIWGGMGVVGVAAVVAS